LYHTTNFEECSTGFCRLGIWPVTDGAHAASGQI
jgi:hypothetical protein